MTRPQFNARRANISEAPAAQTNIAPVAIPQNDKGVPTGLPVPCTSGADGMDVAGLSFAAGGAAMSALGSVVGSVCGKGGRAATGGGSVGCRGGIRAGSVS